MFQLEFITSLHWAIEPFSRWSTQLLLPVDKVNKKVIRFKNDKKEGIVLNYIFWFSGVSGVWCNVTQCNAMHCNWRVSSILNKNKDYKGLQSLMSFLCSFLDHNLWHKASLGKRKLSCWPNGDGFSRQLFGFSSIFSSLKILFSYTHICGCVQMLELSVFCAIFHPRYKMHSRTNLNIILLLSQLPFLGGSQ